MAIKYLLFVAFGGALGALARYLLGQWVQNPGNAFPVGTLLVNILGSLGIGILYVLIVEKMVLHSDWRSVLMVGFLGAFTTFSTFSLESIHLLEKGHITLALSYVLSSVVLCLLAVWIAIVLMRSI